MPDEAVQYQFQGSSKQLKEPIIRLKNAKQKHKTESKNLRRGRSNHQLNGTFLKGINVYSVTLKRPKRSQKTTKVDDFRILSLVGKTLNI